MFSNCASADRTENNMKLRILLIGFDKGGGIATICQEVKNILNKDDQFLCESIEMSTKTNKLKYGRGVDYIKYYIRVMFKIFKFCPHYVYLQISQTGYFHQSISLLIGKLLGKKTIAHFHAKDNVPGSERLISQKLILLSQIYVDRLVVLTEASKKAYYSTVGRNLFM